MYNSSQAPIVISNIQSTPQLEESFGNNFWPFTDENNEDLDQKKAIF